METKTMWCVCRNKDTGLFKSNKKVAQKRVWHIINSLNPLRSRTEYYMRINCKNCGKEIAIAVAKGRTRYEVVNSFRHNELCNHCGCKVI